MNSPTIRQATANDINTISAIEQRCFTPETAYPRRQLAYLALKANSTCIVEVQENIIRGFIIATYRKDSLTSGIETIDVDLPFQNQGVGAKLLQAAEADMKQKGMKYAQLEVSEGNTAAQNLYRKAGYIFKERLPNYYRFDHSGTRHAVRMVKLL
jgi:ribosomal protein S18 acetylase RimI-like enzyme